MSNIMERGGRFTARVRRNGQSAAKTFSHKRDALAWARRTEADMEAGRRVASTTAAASPVIPTLKAAIEDYRVKVAAKMKGAKDYTYLFDELCKASFAGKPINEVTPFDLAQWRDEQLSVRKPATVLRKLGMLSGVFTWSVKERGWMTINPLSQVRMPRANDGRARTLSEDEWQWLMFAASSSKADWLPHALTVYARSAMRRSELFGLVRTSVDYEACTAYLADTKNGSARNVPLCRVALESLRKLDQQAEQRGDSQLIPLGAVGSISTRFKATVVRAKAAYLADCKYTTLTPPWAS